MGLHLHGRFAAKSCSFQTPFTSKLLPRQSFTLPQHRQISWLKHKTATARAAVTTVGHDEIPAELKKIVTTFSMVPDPKIKYQQLLFYAKKLQPLPAAEHTEANKVKGCVSQVWMVPEMREGKVFWRADSDSQLTKGLAALLVQGLSNCTPEEVVRIQPQFLEQLGLGQALTPSRNNGFLNMFKLMQAKSLQLLSKDSL